jgi:hypothetical protein
VRTEEKYSTTLGESNRVKVRGQQAIVVAFMLNFVKFLKDKDLKLV